MIKLFCTKFWAVSVCAAILCVGCSKEQEQPAAAAAVGAASEILKYVPADSPYVFGSLAPLPDEVLDQLEPKLDRVLISYQSLVREAFAARRAEMSEDQRNSESARRMQAFVDEASRLLSVQGLRDAGIERGSVAAVYGNGLLPVVRVQLSDGARFEATVARLEEQAGSAMPVAEIDGQSYRYFDADRLRILLAVMANQAVFALVPTGFDDAQIGRALGLTLPETDITETTILQDIITRYGFRNYAVGFVDLPKIAEIFVGDPSGLDADLMALIGHEGSNLPEVCRAEIRDMAAVAPRTVVGYTDVTPTRFDSTAVVELRADLAAGLQPLATAVPGLGGDSGALMSIGMSLDVKAAREFLEARLDAIEADPWECEYFADLQSDIAASRSSLNQPVPPMVYDFKGFLAVIDELEGLNVATQTPPTSIDGTFLLAMDNAQALVAMGTMFSPDLAALNLRPDGNPVALELPQLQAMGVEAFAALSESALAVSLGDGAEAEVKAALTADASDPPPLFGISIDAARYYSFVGAAVAASDTGGNDAPTPEMRAAITGTMSAIADLYDRMTVDVLLTANGIEFRMSETLKE